MTLARGRGRITIARDEAIIVARCPLCGSEHRYNKGDAKGDEIAEIRKRGFTDEWLPCQKDLPGNFWRIVISDGRKGTKSGPERRGRGTRAA